MERAAFAKASLHAPAWQGGKNGTLFWQGQTANNHPGMMLMTYNFDPDRWYADEYGLLEQALEQGRITPAEFEHRVEALSAKYDDMITRLDGTYQLPGQAK
jgi:hypothetical protein